MGKKKKLAWKTIYEMCIGAISEGTQHKRGQF
jgi:hypothetical protein